MEQRAQRRRRPDEEPGRRLRYLVALGNRHAHVQMAALDRHDGGHHLGQAGHAARRVWIVRRQDRAGRPANDDPLLGGDLRASRGGARSEGREYEGKREEGREGMFQHGCSP